VAKKKIPARIAELHKVTAEIERVKQSVGLARLRGDGEILALIVKVRPGVLQCGTWVDERLEIHHGNADKIRAMDARTLECVTEEQRAEYERERVETIAEIEAHCWNLVKLRAEIDELLASFDLISPRPS
jgi:hypothetical protein